MEIHSGDLIVLAAIVFGTTMSTIVVGMALNSWRKVAETRSREESRREISAYVAEGSITPIEAERILRAGGPKTIRESIGEALERHGVKCT